MLPASPAFLARPVARTAATVAVLVAARGLDALSTWTATRDLSLETNPLTRLLHVGWAGLLTVNAAVIAFIGLCAWRAARTPPVLPPETGLDRDAFVARYWFAFAGRRSLGQAVFWLPADRRVRLAFVAGPGTVLVVAASAVAATWNVLVARGVVTGRTMGFVGVIGFWSLLSAGVVLSVRGFLLRSYARYLRQGVANDPSPSSALP
jgi:hypothetical protein